jgi:aspartokinase/homoserine dehydrogenase 1
MSLLVMKFGGTSVGSAECIRRAAEIVRSAQKGYQVVVVVSAMGGVTDQIVEALHKARTGSVSDVEAICQALRKRHAAAVAELFSTGARETVAASVGGVMDRLADVCSGVTKVAALPPQISDMALSLGEEMSARILASYLEQQGTPAVFVDSGECIVTDGKFGEATPDFDATTRAARALLMPLVSAGTVPVVTGYRGATSSGQLTTLGRGGSDYSATILGAVLAAGEIWIWTDVDGVLSADPRLTKNAATLDEITFNEAVELSHYGAKVVHQRAIQPARNAAIPVWIKNSFHPEAAGTRIGSNPSAGGSPVKAVTAVNRASLITVSTRQDVHPAEIFGRLLMRLAGEHVDLLFSAQSAQNALLFALRETDERNVLDVIRRLFRTEFSHGVLDPVNVQRNVAVIAVLGEAMKGTPGILARLFSTVAEREVSVMAVAQGASELSICFAVPAQAANQVVQSVHDELCVSAARSPSNVRSSTRREPQKVES